MKDYKYWWNQAISWDAYKELLDSLLEQGKTTGEEQSEELLAYAQLNRQRMKRIEKTFKIEEELKEVIENQRVPNFKILAITEGWCGDAAQSAPVVAQMAKLFPQKIEMKVILRDKDTSLIDQFLTNGGRAIPKFLFLDENYNLIAHWGPRPEAAQKAVIEMKNANATHEEIAEQIHTWYAKDKTHSLQSELRSLISEKMN